jgi:3-(methylthio)propanoyl-CoA dehydrogenase
MRNEAEDEGLIALIDAVETAAKWLLSASIDDRLSGSAPFLTMVSVATAGWLMERQARAARERLESGAGDPVFLKSKIGTSAYFLRVIVAEAYAQKTSAMAGSALLYALTDAELAF